LLGTAVKVGTNLTGAKEEATEGVRVGEEEAKESIGAEEGVIEEFGAEERVSELIVGSKAASAEV
jgi:hypothetical protein